MKIRTKLPLYTSITVFITIVAITMYSIIDFRKKTLQSIESYKFEQTEIIKNELKDNVGNAYSMIDQAYLMSSKSEDSLSRGLSKDVSKSMVLSSYLNLTKENIRQMRYGEAGYIWINEIDPPYTVRMHPIKPEMEGTAQVFYIKETQQNVYEAFADVVHNNGGEGFLQYDFYKPGSNERIPKLSFIKLYEPLGWVIGMGVYVDHIDKMVARKTDELNQQTSQMINYILLLGFILITLAGLTLYLFGKTITDAIYNVRQQLFDMSKGIVVQKTIEERTDEIGDMNKSLNALIDGVNSYSEFALSIGKGNLEADFSTLSDEDNLGNSLLKMRESLTTAKEEEEIRQQENERRNWANEGYTMFSDLMRKSSNENLREMAYDVIENMVKYTGSVQGGIFIYNDEEENNHYIELLASTAYNRRKFKEKIIQPGDGLIGTCALEKQMIYLTNVPKDYIDIRSGLGTANPESILIEPLMMEDNIIGIIELAAFKKYKDFEIEFVEKVSESIASSLYAAKINSKTAILLKDFDTFKEKISDLERKLVLKDLELKKAKKDGSSNDNKNTILSFR
jgi:signal transduction histidine kinase